MGDVTEATLGELREVSRIPGTDIPLQKSPFYSVLLWTIPILVRLMFRIRYRGIHRLPPKGAMILAANHTSHIDPFAVTAGARRRTHYLSKDAHFENPFTAFVMNSTGQIRTHRESGAVDALSRAADVLEAGLVMGIFPEGTRSRREQAPFLSEGKTGVARLAATHPNVPVHPATIMGAREVMAPGDKIIRFGKRVDVTYGVGITWNEWIVHPEGGAQDEVSIRSIIESDEPEQRAAMGGLYRRFTAQVIGTMAALDAP